VRVDLEEDLALLQGLAAYKERWCVLALPSSTLRPNSSAPCSPSHPTWPKSEENHRSTSSLSPSEPDCATTCKHACKPPPHSTDCSTHKSRISLLPCSFLGRHPPCAVHQWPSLALHASAYKRHPNLANKLTPSSSPSQTSSPSLPLASSSHPATLSPQTILLAASRSPSLGY
jgi:hypothetical protein